MKTGKYSFGIFYLEKSSDVIFVEFPNNLNVTLPVAKDLVASRLNFTQNRKHYFVIDVSNVRAISSDAREFMQHPNKGLKNILGVAFIASNPVGVLFANIFIKTKKSFDAKLFSNKDDAFNWIVRYREKINLSGKIL